MDAVCFGNINEQLNSAKLGSVQMKDLHRSFVTRNIMLMATFAQRGQFVRNNWSFVKIQTFMCELNIIFKGCQKWRRLSKEAAIKLVSALISFPMKLDRLHRFISLFTERVVDENCEWRFTSEEGMNAGSCSSCDRVQRHDVAPRSSCAGRPATGSSISPTFRARDSSPPLRCRR